MNWRPQIADLSSVSASRNAYHSLYLPNIRKSRTKGYGTIRVQGEICLGCGRNQALQHGALGRHSIAPAPLQSSQCPNLHLHVGIKSLCDRMRDERPPLFLQEFDEAGFLGDQGVDAGGFAVDGGNDLNLLFMGRGASISIEPTCSQSALASWHPRIRPQFVVSHRGSAATVEASAEVYFRFQNQKFS